MLAYAPRRTTNTRSPGTLVFVAAAHVVAFALVLTARNEFTPPDKEKPTAIVFVDPIKPPPLPPPPSPSPVEPRQPLQSTIDRPTIIVPTPRPTVEPLNQGPPLASTDPVIGNAVVPQPLPVPIPAIVRKAPRFATPPDLVRPPYPESKRREEEEASLRLSLAIDARGRVTSVAPVGAADPTFLQAARRHIVRHWRYQPASEGGDTIASTVVVTLTFTLEE